MKINACEKCHKLFESSTSERVCPNCKLQIELKFKVVRNYIRSNKGAGLDEVSSKCGVPTSQLLKWIREERLYFDEASNIAIPCMNCGDLIKIGKYCPKCKTEMKRELTVAYAAIKTDKEKESKVISFRSSMRHL